VCDRDGSVSLGGSPVVAGSETAAIAAMRQGRSRAADLLKVRADRGLRQVGRRAISPQYSRPSP
jgi:hypothetical protein